MGGKGGSSTDKWQQHAYDNAYKAAQSGQDLETALRNQPNYGEATRLGFSDFFGEQTPMSPGFEMFDFGKMFGAMQGPQVDYAAQLAAAEEARRVAEGTAARDRLFSAYMDAAGTATDYVNSEIDREMANAKLLGIDYAVDDEMKGQRISDYFATVWGEGEQAQLEGYMKDFGDPEGFTGFHVTRGDGSKYAKRPGSETQESVSSGIKPPTLATQDEDVLGGRATVLGG